MDNQPLVTIAIITYNRPGFLKKAINSCLSQTYKNIDIFISDNCSEDPEVERICREYAAKDSRIRYVRQETNIGMFNNWKFVERHILGEYVLGLGDDDWLSPNYVEECMKVILNNPDCSLVSGYINFYDQNNDLIKRCYAQNISQDNYFDRINSYFNQYEAGLSFGLKRTSYIEEIGQPKKRPGEDWISMCKLIFLGKFYILENCTYHKFHNGTTSSTESIKQYFNFDPTLSVSDVQEIFAQASRDAVLNDEFYHRHLSKRERKKLASLVYYGICIYKEEQKRKLSEAIKYMMYNPRFLFDKTFHILFLKPETKQRLKYISRNPLFLFHKEFYNIRHKSKLFAKEKPLVSIVIPTYNRRDSLKKAIESTVNQFYKNIEIIIADDNSDDGTEELCREYAAKDPRIKYFKHNKNIGKVANSNFAAAQITGEYCIGLNDDNRLSRNYIEECLSFMLQNPNYSVVFGLTKMFTQNDNLLNTTKPYKLNHRNVNKRIESYIKNNSTHISNGFYKTSILKTMIENDGEIFKDNLTKDRDFIIKNLIAGKGYVLDDIYFHKIDYGFSENFDSPKKSCNLDNLNPDSFCDNTILKDKSIVL